MSEERLMGIVNKGWGHEEIWVSNDDYCSKYMHFTTNAKSSMHFHKEKTESWLIINGKFLLDVMDMKDSSIQTHELVQGQSLTIEPMTPHQVTCIEAGCILEVSTADSVEDNYRIAPGDSQNV
jgi:mannose-6-phosphate isomerase-like protein (cupin superfamily)